jgi:hypothetical protein
MIHKYRIAHQGQVLAGQSHGPSTARARGPDDHGQPITASMTTLMSSISTANHRDTSSLCVGVVGQVPSIAVGAAPATLVNVL